MAKVGVRKSSAVELLDQYSQKIISESEGKQSFFTLVHQSMEDKLARVRKITEDAFLALGYKNATIEANEQELQKNVEEAVSNVSNLNGINVDQLFVQRLLQTNPFEVNYQKQFDLLMNYLENELGNSDPKLEDLIDIFAKEVLGETLGARMTSNGSLQSRSTGRMIGNISRVYSELGRKTREAVNKYIKGTLMQVSGYKEKLNGMTYEINWLVENVDMEAFLKMPTNQRKLLFDELPTLQETINNEYKNFIISQCNVSGEDKLLLEQCIDHVLHENDLAFFVGANSSQLIGILGEIQGLYLFRKIIKKQGANATVSWVGGIRNPHADLLLESGLKTFGIQVKNTSLNSAQQEIRQIEFQGLNLTAAKTAKVASDIFSTSPTQYASDYASRLGLTKELFSAIQNALAAKTFNVLYSWKYNTDSKKMEATSVESNIKFNDVREQILSVARRAEAIMGLFSAALMYMQEADFEKDNSSQYSNSFYLIGGATVVSAATILAQILQEAEALVKHEIESYSRFNIEVKTGHETNKTIIDFWNNTKQREHHADIISFMLQSSYNFG